MTCARRSVGALSQQAASDVSTRTFPLDSCNADTEPIPRIPCDTRAMSHRRHPAALWLLVLLQGGNGCVAARPVSTAATEPAMASGPQELVFRETRVGKI